MAHQHEQARVSVHGLFEFARRNGVSVEQVLATISAARATYKTPRRRRILCAEQGTRRTLIVVRRGVGLLNTDYGPFYQFDFAINDEWEKYSVLVMAKLDNEAMPIFRRSSLLLRIDSGCQTGQVFGDRTCDCREQLHKAMEAIQGLGEGIIIHIPGQDGRGLGLPLKLATLTLQDQLHLSTVDSASVLVEDGVIDRRTYTGAISILKFFRLAPQVPINLLTNNPSKIAPFTENGYTITKFVPLIIQPTEHTLRHLRAKQEHLGHINLVNLRNKEPGPR
jgi:3,4-dihydroxy 2-butanone 4-phosphate synthase/GTP cyclohydrolase II